MPLPGTHGWCNGMRANVYLLSTSLLLPPETSSFYFLSHEMTWGVSLTDADDPLATIFLEMDEADLLLLRRWPVGLMGWNKQRAERGKIY